MKVKSLGFSITNNNQNVDSTDVMNALIKSSTRIHNRMDYTRQILISESNGFYYGLVVTFRNQKKNCKSSIANGKFKLKVEELIGGDKLASFNFFCIKKQSLNGLYMYHHGSCSLNGLFTHLQTVSNEFIRLQCEKEIAALGEKPAKKLITEINKKYKDRIGFSLITNKKDISAILREFKEIKHATFKFDYIDFKGGPLTPLEAFSNSTVVDFNIDPSDRKKVNALTQGLSDAYKSLNGIVKAKVIATDHSNVEKIVDFMNCPAFFETYDFDVIAEMADGVTDDNYVTNRIFDIIKDEMVNGKNKNVFN
ncbi:hypothetical protein [Atlantibacter hermannii]|uniref:Uncharacterized protein n=1 Tax=Atlantibacter hermannii NBRC 105704 TaxID=1115512 RepID=H5UYY0_ATLHE|nr:hypothetical protein [Atlantibacter hermannii]QPS90083.1 hypothetical protein I6G45_10910 [Atlantibacter hermannii]GAB50134.1 hypothetical protein EH105704_01_01390 [Atlantibacter hermannii NBRC 105704]VDZ73106.1 Uncharacterised protein [Atlantibacter hermannii]